MRKLLDGLSRFSICITHAYLPRGRCDLEGQVISGPGAKKGFRKYTWVLIVPVGLIPLCVSLATVLGIVGLDPAEQYTRVSAALYFDLPFGAISTGIAAYGFMHRSSWRAVRLYGVFSAVTLIAVVAVAGVVFPAVWSPLGSLKDSLECVLLAIHLACYLDSHRRATRLLVVYHGAEEKDADPSCVCALGVSRVFRWACLASNGGSLYDSRRWHRHPHGSSHVGVRAQESEIAYRRRNGAVRALDRGRLLKRRVAVDDG